jgi:hypothetical protein
MSLEVGVLDFRFIGIRKRKVRRNIPRIFQNSNIWAYLEKNKNTNIFLCGVIGNISRLFMSRGLCWWILFLPTVSNETRQLDETQITGIL